MMKRTLLSTILLCVCVMMSALIPFGEGKLCVSKMAVNAVRIQYTFGDAVASDLPDWIYVKKDHVENQDISSLVDAQQQPLTVKDKKEVRERHISLFSRGYNTNSIDYKRHQQRKKSIQK